jgi:uncharacterized membrane protein YhaH (DUF805 family)
MDNELNTAQYKSPKSQNAETFLFLTKGRITRLTFWRRYFASAVILILCLVLFKSHYLESYNYQWNQFVEQLFLFIIPIALSIFVAIQGAKRLHDVNESAWFFLIPFYNIYLLFVKGTNGINKFGIDPNNTQISTKSSILSYLFFALLVLGLLILNAVAYKLFTFPSKVDETNENGFKYRVIIHSVNAPQIKKNELVKVNLIIETEYNSILLETYSSLKPIYIPYDDPIFKRVFLNISEGDSIKGFFAANLLYNNNLGIPAPINLKSDENIHFTMKIVESLSQSELLNKIEEIPKVVVQKDTVIIVVKPQVIKKNVVSVPGIPFTVLGANFDEFSNNLVASSRSILLNGYIPTNCKFNLAKMKFTCRMVKVNTSPYLFIGIYIAPRSMGFCESCQNVLLKNHGSKVLYNCVDNNYFFSIIAVAK